VRRYWKTEEPESPRPLTANWEYFQKSFHSRSSTASLIQIRGRDIPWLPENNKRVRYLLDEEEPKVFAILNGRRKHLRPLVTLAIGTGMRRGDQLNLQWEKVDFQRDVIYVPNSKTGKDYGVPMNADLRNTLLVLRSEANGSEYVFINPKTKKPYTDLKKAFGTACRSGNS
jgi:integrase